MPYSWQGLSCVSKTHHLSEAQLGFNSRLLNPPHPPTPGSPGRTGGQPAQSKTGTQGRGQSKGDTCSKMKLLPRKMGEEGQEYSGPDSAPCTG